MAELEEESRATAIVEAAKAADSKQLHAFESQLSLLSIFQRPTSKKNLDKLIIREATFSPELESSHESGFCEIKPTGARIAKPPHSHALIDLLILKY